MNNYTIIGKKIFNFIENRQDLTYLGDLKAWLIEILATTLHLSAAAA